LIVPFKINASIFSFDRSITWPRYRVHVSAKGY
jgi:hypothetical protein